MIASQNKQKAIDTVLENQTDIQSHADLQEVPCQLADAQSAMAMWMAEILFQYL